MQPNLLTHYKEKVVPALIEKLGLTNPHQVPALEKIVVTSCMGSTQDRKAAVEDAVNEIAKITGQKPSVTFARKSVANFKLRENEALGARVTLRGTRMWEFLDRFVNVAAPNVEVRNEVQPTGVTVQNTVEGTTVNVAVGGNWGDWPEPEVSQPVTERDVTPSEVNWDEY